MKGTFPLPPLPWIDAHKYSNFRPWIIFSMLELEGARSTLRRPYTTIKIWYNMRTFLFALIYAHFLFTLIYALFLMRSYLCALLNPHFLFGLVYALFLMRSYLCALIYALFVMRSFVHVLMRSFIHALMRSFLHSCALFYAVINIRIDISDKRAHFYYRIKYQKCVP